VLTCVGVVGVECLVILSLHSVLLATLGGPSSWCSCLQDQAPSTWCSWKGVSDSFPLVKVKPVQKKACKNADNCTQSCNWIGVSGDVDKKNDIKSGVYLSECVRINTSLRIKVEATC
jgi:hypothetical protein